MLQKFWFQLIHAIRRSMSHLPGNPAVKQALGLFLLSCPVMSFMWFPLLLFPYHCVLFSVNLIARWQKGMQMLFPNTPSFREIQFRSVQSLSPVWLFATPWTAARQASLSITNSWNPPKPMSIESVMPSNQLILCRPLLLLPSIFPSIIFKWVSSSHQVAKVLKFQLQHQSFHWTLRTGLP